MACVLPVPEWDLLCRWARWVLSKRATEDGGDVELRSRGHHSEEENG